MHDIPLSYQEIYENQFEEDQQMSSQISAILNPVDDKDQKDYADEMMFKKKDLPKDVVEWYNGLPVKPFIKKEDLNNSDDEPDVNKPVDVWIGGIEIDF